MIASNSIPQSPTPYYSGGNASPDQGAMPQISPFKMEEFLKWILEFSEESPKIVKKIKSKRELTELENTIIQSMTMVYNRQKMQKAIEDLEQSRRLKMAFIFCSLGGLFILIGWIYSFFKGN